MNVVILAVGAMAGDGRQRAEERMGNKNKNNTLKPWKTFSQNQITRCPRDLVNKTLVLHAFGEQCTERRHLRHFPREWMTDRRGPWADRLDHDLQGLNFTTIDQVEDLTRPGPKARRIYCNVS